MKEMKQFKRPIVLDRQESKIKLKKKKEIENQIVHLDQNYLWSLNVNNH